MLTRSSGDYPNYAWIYDGLRGVWKLVSELGEVEPLDALQPEFTEDTFPTPMDAAEEGAALRPFTWRGEQFVWEAQPRWTMRPLRAR